MKGIWYDQTKKLFYIFIRRFFLRFEEDLVMTGFYFNETAYRKNVGVLSFENSDKHQPIRFEIERTHLYVKTFPSMSLYVPFDQVFKLITSDSSNAFVEPHEKPKLIHCPGNTLVLRKQYVFCFYRDNTYRLLYDRSLKEPVIDPNPDFFTVDSIFKDKSWNLTLLFIFNYLDDSVVFVNELRIRVLKYANFYMDLTRMYYNTSADNGIVDNHNCFVKNDCTQPMPMNSTNPTTVLTPVPRTRPMNPRGILGNLKWPVVIVIVGLVIVALFVGYVTIRKTSKSDWAISAATFYRSSTSSLPSFKSALSKKREAKKSKNEDHRKARSERPERWKPKLPVKKPATKSTSSSRWNFPFRSSLSRPNVFSDLFQNPSKRPSQYIEKQQPASSIKKVELKPSASDASTQLQSKVGSKLPSKQPIQGPVIETSDFQSTQSFSQERPTRPRKK